MIDWVDSMGRSWGHWWRRELDHHDRGAPSWWPKIVEKAVYDGGGRVLMHGEILEFQQAFLRVRLIHREILANHYIDPRPVSRKAKALHISRRTWWNRLHVAQRAVASRLDDISREKTCTVSA